jgi:hypothetical protein
MKRVNVYVQRRASVTANTTTLHVHRRANSRIVLMEPSAIWVIYTGTMYRNYAKANETRSQRIENLNGLE